jgi:adenosylcobyric acid synthase
VADHVARGGRVLGVCGGLQVLGEALIDTEGIDGNAPGLGLLPLVTTFARDKTVQRTEARFGPLVGAWAALSNVPVRGYEIHHGQTAPHPAMVAAGAVAREVMPGLAWQNGAGNVLGIYLHGLFEDPRVLQALFGAAALTLDAVFDRLADTVQTHFEPGVLDALLTP